MLNALESLFAGLVRYDHIYCQRLEDPWDQNSRYHSSLVGRNPFGRRTIKVLRQKTGENFMADTMSWNRSEDVAGSEGNDDYIPWQDSVSVMTIPIITLEGRGIVISIHSLSHDFDQDDLEIAQKYIYVYLENRQVPILTGDELAEFIQEKR